MGKAEAVNSDVKAIKEQVDAMPGISAADRRAVTEANTSLSPASREKQGPATLAQSRIGGRQAELSSPSRCSC